MQLRCSFEALLLLIVVAGEFQVAMMPSRKTLAVGCQGKTPFQGIPGVFCLSAFLQAVVGYSAKKTKLAGEQYFCRMKTFALIWNIFSIILFAALGVIIIIDYRKTKDNAEISPEDLKQLRKNYFFLLMLLCVTLMFEHFNRLFL